MSSAPDEVRAWAQARLDARAGKDWAEADRLRAAIEAAGWRIIDRGSQFSLEPSHAPDVLEAGRTRYGRSAAVPSRLNEPVTAFVTVVLLASDQPADLTRTLAGLRKHGPLGTQVVIVADRPSPGQEAELLAQDGPAAEPIGGLPPETVWTSARLGQAGATNAGMRRSVAPVIVLLDSSVEPISDLLSPLVRALDDPGVALAGPWGLVSDDLRRFEAARPGDVDAIEGVAVAFRRDDVIERGFLDERFDFYLNLDIWWSLVLRDGGEAGRPRRAVQVAEALAIRHDHRGQTSVQPAERDRLGRRNFYRVLDRFGARRDLLTTARLPPA
jgi:cysteinyl-tRNA synthetase